jgi:ketosteroid isomerase-like protein
MTRHHPFWTPIFTLLAVSSCISTTRAPSRSVEDTAAEFLRAYAAGHRDAVMSVVADDSIHVYGSDVAEVVTTKAGVQAMLDADQQLWRGTARFGSMRNVSSVAAGSLVTLFFDVPFIVDDHPEVIVRFATVWRRDGARWKLVQSANVVPTVGQSAAELIHGSKR